MSKTVSVKAIIKNKPKASKAKAKIAPLKRTSFEQEAWYSAAKEKFSVSKNYSKEVADRIFEANR